MKKIGLICSSTLKLMCLVINKVVSCYLEVAAVEDSVEGADVPEQSDEDHRPQNPPDRLKIT